VVFRIGEEAPIPREPAEPFAGTFAASSWVVIVSLASRSFHDPPESIGA
jgi:hypothetical protein